MKVILFGVGNYYQEQKEKIKSFGEIEIVAFADNNNTLWNQKVDGILVISPVLIPTFEYDAIIIMSVYVCEIYAQLLENGIEEHRIIIWERYYKKQVQDSIKFFNPSLQKKEGKKRVLIITQKMNYDGGTLAAIYAAMALEDRGISVVLSAPDGNKKLINEVTEKGITVSICSSLPYIFEQHKKWIQEFDIVIVNLFTMIESVYEVISFRPVFWWVHEASLIYELMYRKMPYISNMEYTDAINIYAVSKIAQQNFNRKFEDQIKKILTVGIPDVAEHKHINKINDKKMVFAIIGAIHSMKLQHVFLKAAMAMNDNKKIEFWIIGKSYDDEYFEKIKKISTSISSVRMLGEMTRADIRKAFADIDVLVCASSEETLSISMIEGMMYGKVCITTLNTGIASYIQDGVNGFVIPSDNAVILVEKLQWIIDNSHQAEEIGKAARKTYEKYFTLKVFGDNLEEILDETEQKWKDQYSISKQLQA